MENKTYDVVIIGGGPAGLTAGIYCSRAGLKSLILEKAGIGGQLLKMDMVENYPGFPGGVQSLELIEKVKKQAEKFGVEFLDGEASEIKSQINSRFQINIQNGELFHTKAIIIATGANPKLLGVKGEKELQGKGISYCATCDGPLFKNKEIVVVGGGDTAVGEAIYLTRFVKKLTLVHRRDKMRAAKVLQDRLLSEKNVEVKWNSVATEILGENKVSGVKIKDLKTDIENQIPAQGVFIFVGLEPNTAFLKGKAELNKDGFVVADEHMKTSQDGIFACGDVRKNPLKQIVTACSEGAIAAHSCLHYIEGLKT